tara:strand:- start:805 stop:987 length:183 start_codon:yes stop_codon:yes gene_type:complete
VPLELPVWLERLVLRELPELKEKKEIEEMLFKLMKFLLTPYQLLPTIQIIQKHMVILIQH